MHFLRCKYREYCGLLAVSDFQSVPGYFAIGSLIVLPVWLFALHKGLVMCLWIPLLVQHAITFILTVGRGLCALVEVCTSPFVTAYNPVYFSMIFLSCISSTGNNLQYEIQPV